MQNLFCTLFVALVGASRSQIARGKAGTAANVGPAFAAPADDLVGVAITAQNSQQYEVGLSPSLTKTYLDVERYQSMRYEAWQILRRDRRKEAAGTRQVH